MRCFVMLTARQSAHPLGTPASCELETRVTNMGGGSLQNALVLAELHRGAAIVREHHLIALLDAHGHDGTCRVATSGPDGHNHRFVDLQSTGVKTGQGATNMHIAVHRVLVLMPPHVLVGGCCEWHALLMAAFPTLATVSGSKMPPTVFSGGASFCTSTRSRSGISLFAIEILHQVDQCSRSDLHDPITGRPLLRNAIQAIYICLLWRARV